MEANGLNYKMFVYQSHDYMDLRPETHFATYKDIVAANSYVEHMRMFWNSGTISEMKEVSPIEFFMARQSPYWKGYEEALDRAALDCTQDWIDEYEFYVEHKDYDVASLLHEWNCKEEGLL